MLAIRLVLIKRLSKPSCRCIVEMLYSWVCSKVKVITPNEKKCWHDLNDNTICKQRGMRRFSALVQGIVKTASNHNGRQLWVWVSVWVGIRPLMDIRHKSAVSTRQGDPQFTTASRSHFRGLLQAAVCFMPHKSDAVTVSGRFAWWPLATVAMAYWYYENELQMVKMRLQYM